MNDQLQKYFEFAANVWLSFSPGDYKEKFPRSFKFAVTVPHTFSGEPPPGLKGVPQFEVSIVAQDLPASAAAEEKGGLHIESERLPFCITGGPHREHVATLFANRIVMGNPSL